MFRNFAILKLVNSSSQLPRPPLPYCLNCFLFSCWSGGWLHLYDELPCNVSQFRDSETGQFKFTTAAPPSSVLFKLFLILLLVGWLASLVRRIALQCFAISRF